MLRTRTIVAVGVFTVVLAVVLFARSRPDRYQGSASGPGRRPAGAPAPVVAAEVDELELVDAGKPATVLKKEGGAWKLTAPLADAADEKNVEQVLKTLAELQFKHVVAESKDSHEQLQVRDQDVVRVTAKKAGKPLVVLAIGKTGHVRVGDEARVWAVGKMNRFAFAREPKMWRNRELFRFEKDQVDRVEVSVGAQKVVAKREAPPPAAIPDGGPPPPPPADSWKLVEGEALVGGVLDESVPAAVVSSLSRLDVAEFSDAATPEVAGLTPPRALAAVVLADGSRKALELGKDDGQFTFARVEGQARVFMLRKSSADALVKPPLQWRDKTLAKLNAKDVARVDLVKGADHVSFERVDDKTWKTLAPADLGELDSGAVQTVAGAFANLRAAQIAEVSPRDAKAGLAKPTGTIKLWKKGEAAPAVTVTVGALVDRAYFVQVAGRPEVFTVPDASVNRWLKSAKEFQANPAPPPGAGSFPGLPPGMSPH